MQKLFKNSVFIFMNVLCAGSMYSSMDSMDVQKKPDPSCFKDLIAQDALFLRYLYMLGQSEYVSDLHTAEQTVRTALTVQTNRSLLKERCSKDNVTLVQWIANKKEKCLALFTAIDQKNGELAEIILNENPYAVHHYLAVEDNFLTALHYATKVIDVPLRLLFVQLLLGKGANIDSIDGEGNTALHYAVNSARDWELTKMLLNAEADVTMCNNENKMAFDYWICGNEIAKGLVEPYIQYALCRALMNNNSQKTVMIVRRFPWMSHVIEDENPTKILEWAYEHCVHEGKVLKSVVDYENCLIHYLCFADYAGSERLIAAGVPVHRRGYEGLTPRQWAEKMNNFGKTQLIMRTIMKNELIEEGVSHPVIYDLSSDVYSLLGDSN